MSSNRQPIAITVIALFIFCVGCLPSEYKVERSTVIEAPAAVIFDYVNDLEKNELWSPWVAEDPTINTTLGEKTEGVGATYSWTSENSGDGTLEIVESVPHRLIRTKLDFGDQGTAEAVWNFEESSEGVKTTWGFSGKVEGIGEGIFALFIDGMVGPYYEQGLSRLKELSEAQDAGR